MDPTNTKELKHFKDAFLRVRSDYLRSVDDAVLINSALKGVEELKGEPGTFPAEEVVEAALDSMVTSLDPHSTYLNAEELKETFISTRGQFGGLGIEVTMEDGYVRVVSPIEGTPAYRSGLKPGDLITHLDGESIHGITILNAVKKMRGNPGTDIHLTIRRENTDPFDVTITRAIITVKAVRWRPEGTSVTSASPVSPSRPRTDCRRPWRISRINWGRVCAASSWTCATTRADCWISRGPSPTPSSKAAASCRCGGRDPEQEQVFRADPAISSRGCRSSC